MSKSFKPGQRTMRSAPQPELDPDSLVAQQREADVEKLAYTIVKLQQAVDESIPWNTRLLLRINNWLKRLLRRK